MKDNCFIDTNIFLYAFSDIDLDKQLIAKEIILQSCKISTQVINEASNNFIKKLTFDEYMITSFVESAYARYEIIDFSKPVFIRASGIRTKYKYSYYDSLIIAAALESQCDILYSEDMHHNQIIEKNLKIINPFRNQHEQK